MIRRPRSSPLFPYAPLSRSPAVHARESDVANIRSKLGRPPPQLPATAHVQRDHRAWRLRDVHDRSEEHTSELQSPDHLVCRLLLEKKQVQYRRSLVYTTTHP